MSESNGTQFNLNTATFPPGKSLEGFWEFVRNGGINNRIYGWGGLNRGSGTELDPRRDIHKECGHPDSSELTPHYYQALYDRNPVAARVVEVMPKETWQVLPEVYETEDDEPTLFETMFDQVGKNLKGRKSHYRSEKYNPIWDYLKRLDEQSGIGSFGVLLFGFSDVRKGSGVKLSDPCQPVLDAFNRNIQEMSGVEPAQEIDDLPEDEMMESEDEEEGSEIDDGGTKATTGDQSTQRIEEDTKKAKTKGHKGLKLLYLRVFPQSLAYVSEWDTSDTSPRKGMPIRYILTLNDPELQKGGAGRPTNTITVHWTRVLHVADNLTSDEAYGVPRMKQVLNELLNVDKVLASSPEMMYRGALPGISFETHPTLGGDVRINSAALKDMYEQYINSMDRVIVTSGMTAKSLAPTVVDPTPHFAIQIDAICIKIPIPKRIFVGSERGELASTQDDDSWNDTVKGRQNGHATCNIVVAFIDMLIDATVLPIPENGFYVSWPDITSASAQQKATVAMTTVQALAAYFSGDLPNHINPMTALTNIFPFTEEQAYALLGGGASDDTDEYGEYEDDESLAGGDGADEQPKDGNDDDTDQATPQPPIPKQNMTDNAFCPTGPGGGVDPHCASKKSDRVGPTIDVTSSTSTYTEDEINRAMSKMADIAEAEEGYRTFDAPGQIRIKDAGFAGIGKIFPVPIDTSKLEKVMELSPEKTYYVQSSVIREAIEKKLRGTDEEDSRKYGSFGKLPLVVEEDGKYYLQEGSHRSVSEVLAKGTFRARVIKVVSKTKTGKVKFGKPS